MNKLKLNLKNLTSTLNGVVDTGIAGVRFTKTITSQLKSLKTGGSTATQDALEDT